MISPTPDTVVEEVAEAFVESEVTGIKVEEAIVVLSMVELIKAEVEEPSVAFTMMVLEDVDVDEAGVIELRIMGAVKEVISEVKETVLVRLDVVDVYRHVVEDTDELLPHPR